MAGFQTALQAYIEGQVTLVQLRQHLSGDLRQSPDLGRRYQRALFGLYQQQVLQEPVYLSLVSLVETFDCPDGDPPRADERTLVDPGPGQAGDDQTRISPRALPRTMPRTLPQPAPGDKPEDALPEPPLTQHEDRTRWGAPLEVSVQTPGRTLFNERLDTAPPGVGSVLKERFRLVEFVGYGGMGDVYKAEDSRRIDADDADPLVAIKVLNKTFREHPESLRALQRETRKTQHLAHPNIITVFDFDRDRDTVFMTMELMQGRPLNEEIDAHPRGFARAEVLRYTLGMAEALKYAHQRGVIHADFKPSNVFLHQGVIKVFDFGIARAAKAGQPEPGSVAAALISGDGFDAGSLGALTPSYASPEMLDSEGWVPAPEDDIYALGCITYELLTGRHPFRKGGNKVPANEARAQGLKPARIKGLSRRQWHALQRTLSFQRQTRTPCVQDFIDDFIPKQGLRPLISRWLFWPSAMLLIVGAAYFPVLESWQQRQVTAFVERLAAGDEALIATRLAEIETYASTRRDLYFNDVRVKEALADFFVTRFEQQAAADQYQAVDAQLAQARRIYEDSRRIAEQTEVMRQRRARRLKELGAELTQILDADLEGFILSYRQLQPLLRTIGQVDRNSPMLRDPRAPVHYLAAVRAFGRQQEYAPAMAMLTVALTQFPARQDLLQEQRRLARERQDYQRSKHIDALQQQVLTAWNKQPVLLDPSAVTLAPLIELLALDAQNSVALTARTRLTAALEAAIAPQLAAHRWDSARQLLGQFAGALALPDRERLARMLAQQRYADEDRLKRLLRAINRAARAGDLGTATEDSALSLLSRLRQSAAAPVAVQQARVHKARVRQAQDRIARGYLRQARLDRSQQRWEAARGQLQAARALVLVMNAQRQAVQRQAALEQAVLEQAVLEQAVLEQELTTIAAAETRAQGEGAQASLAAESDRAALAAEIAGLYQDFEATLLAPNALSLLRSEQALALLDHIERLAPQEPGLDKARLQIAAAYLKDAQRLVDQQRLQEAQVLAERGAGLIPESAALESQIDSVQQALQQQQRQTQYRRLLADQQRLQAAFDARTLTPAWEQPLFQGLIEFDARQGDPDFSRRLRRQLSEELLDQARTLRIDQQFDRALGALRSARRFDPDIDGQLAEARAIEQAEQRAKAAQAAARAKAVVAAAKQRFSMQIAANEVRQAKKTSSVIARLLDTEDPFITRQVPKAFAAAYQRLAAQQAKRQRYQQASQLIATARHYTPGSVKLIDKQADYKLQLETQALLRDKAQAGADDLEPLRQSPADLKASVTGAHSSVSASPSASPQPAGRPCTPQLAGYGSRSRAICYDMLDAQQRAPYMVVLPKQGDRQLAISKFEISVTDFNSFCALSGQCPASPVDSQQPVTGLSVTQVEDYTRWLTERTGFSYRLPSMAEWRYAARATGLEQPQDYNCHLTLGGTVLKGGSLVAVKAGKANAWGVVNYLGNAQELVSKGGQLLAAGGHHQDRMSACAITLSRSAVAEGDAVTGIRLLKEI